MLPGKKDLYRFDDFELQPSRRTLLRAGEKIAIAPKTFEVLLCLVERAGHVVLKEELLKAVWPESFVEESNLTQHIFWLRKALAGKAGYITTIPGRGYEFTGEVQAVSETAVAMPSQTPAQPVIGFRIQHSIEQTHIVVEEAEIADVAKAAHRRRVLAVMAAVIAVVAIGSFAAWRWHQRFTPADHHEVVLAQFENSTGDQGFDSALNTLLAIDLEQSHYLVVAGDSDTRKILTLMNRRSDDPLTLPVAQEVCQRLNDQVVLSGLIAPFGQKYLVTLTATDCSTGKTLFHNKAVAGGREDVLKAVDMVAADMRGRLGESLQSQTNSEPPLQQVHTFSLDALRSYSQGLSLAERGRHREALPLFQRAIEIDPKFAAAYLGLALSYEGVGETVSAKSAVAKAYELRDQGDEFLKLKILYNYDDLFTGDLRAQIRNLTTWTQMYPNQPQPWIYLSDTQSTMTRYEEAVVSGRRAVALAPDNVHAYVGLAFALTRLGRLDEAKAICNETIRRKIDSIDIHYQLYELAIFQKDDRAMAEQVAWSKGTDAELGFSNTLLLAAGKAHAAVAAMLQPIQQARKDGFQERALRRLHILMRREADYGMDQELREQLRGDDPSKFPFNLIFAEAELGDIPAAQRALGFFTEQVGTDTMYREYYLPQAQAAIAMAQHKPEEAIADLEIARPWELGGMEGLFLRAQAYLAARQPKLAEAEFRRIIDHPYDGPAATQFGPTHLGLAEALEMQGNHAASRQEYETLFKMWKDADPDLAPLVRAKLEYAKIPATNVALSANSRTP
jgi:DNA-binding winged helix-turn-helix (wHTH) protein/tetratricopeptide (TPR) repeat protein